MLAPLRQTLRRWLREIDAAPPVANDILLASGEVCANVIQHAYGAKDGPLEISLDLCDGTAEVKVRDRGCWRPSSGIHGGHGLPLIQELMESVEVDSGPDGTVVRMHRRDITYLDSAGVALLLRLAERLRSRRRQLHLVVPRGSPVRRVLHFTGVPRVIPLEARLEDALAQCDAGYPTISRDRSGVAVSYCGRPVGR